METHAPDQVFSLRHPHKDHVKLALKAVPSRAAAFIRNYGPGLVGLEIDHRGLWSMSFLSLKYLDVVALLAKGVPEEDATTIVYEAQNYDRSGHAPLLVTEPSKERWSYIHCPYVPARGETILPNVR